MLSLPPALRRIVPYGALALLSLGLLLLLFPAGFLIGQGPFWAHPAGDLSQHMMGASYFAHDQWRWPLYVVPGLGSPEGTNVIFTDSLPLVLPLVRAVFQATGVYIHPFGLWFTLCAVLQAPLFALLLRRLGEDRPAVLVLGGMLALVTPVLLVRYGHLALCAHWVLLLALAQAVRAGQAPCFGRALLWFLPIALLALFIHPYLMVFVVLIAAGAVLHGLWTERISLAVAGAGLAALVLPLLAMMRTTGHLGSQGLVPKPYGEYPLDLASPFLPQRSGLIPGLSDFTLSSGETFSYLGLGVLGLAGLALLLGRRELGAGLRRHGGVVAGAVVVVLFAATYAVTVGGHTVLGLPAARMREMMVAHLRDGVGGRALLDSLSGAEVAALVGLAGLYGLLAVGLLVACWRLRRRRFLAALALGVLGLLAAAAVSPKTVMLLISNFQASSRFVWPLIYLGMALAVVTVARHLPRRQALAVLAVALGVQMADTAPLVAEIRRLPGLPPPVTLPDADAVAEAFAGAKSVILVPNYLCTILTLPEGARRDRAVAEIDSLHSIAARTAPAINSVKNSRMSAFLELSDGGPDRCAAQRAEALADRTPGRARLFLRDGWTGARPLDSLLPEAGPGCRALPIGVLCPAP